MLPFILVGAAAAGAIALKPKCSRCNSKFTLNHKCAICGREVCGTCGVDVKEVAYLEKVILPKGRCCKVHSIASYIEAREIEIKAEKALEEAARGVETFSKNFKGKTPAPKFSKVIETTFYDDRDEAESQLRKLAYKDGCMVVTNVEFIRDTDNSSSYTHGVWQAKGII